LTPLHVSRVQDKFHDPVFRRSVAIALLVSCFYYLTAKLGFEFALQPGSVSILWMPNAVLLAGLLLTPRRWWWLPIVAVLPVHLASEFQSGVPATMVLSWFISNCVQALIGAVLITQFVRDKPRFDRVRDLSVFLICGAGLAPFLASFLDAALVRFNGWGHSSYWEIWRIRCLSNVLATLILVPFIVVWAKGDFSAIRRSPLGRYLEAIALATGLVGVGLFVFYTERAFAEQGSSLLYLPLPFLLWATVRFGLRGVTTALLTIMFLATTGATKGAGPFLTSTTTNNALAIQWFLIVVSIPLLVLVAVVEERRLAEASARDNEERLKLALNAAQMDTWDWHIPENKLIWTETTKNAFRLTLDTELDRESFYLMIHPDDRELVQEATAQAIKHGKPYECEFRMTPSGGVRWFLSKGKVFFDDDGTPTRMLGIGIDITERKKSEAAIARVNQRNRAILEALPDMMFLQNRQGVFLDYSARDSDNLFVPAEEFLGRNVRDILPPKLANRVLEILETLKRGDPPEIFEYSVPINGEQRHYEARLIVAEGENVLSIIRDITDARQAIQAAQESQEKLLQGNKQIRALAARLITAQESERRRISLLLHDDVSQNVAAIGLAISRLKRKLPNSNEEILTELSALGSQVYDLTTQIRRLSHQLHPAVLEHLGLVAALESHVTEFGHQEQIDTRFKAQVQSNPIPLELSVCMYRVALEGLRNVSRHSGAKSAEVILAEEEDHLTLRVSDSGRGFDVEKAKRGTGIGLTSSEERVRLLKGTFEVRSDGISGTVLTARLPMSR